MFNALGAAWHMSFKMDIYDCTVTLYKEETVTACRLLAFSTKHNVVMVVKFTVKYELCALFPLKVFAKCVCNDPSSWSTRL